MNVFKNDDCQWMKYVKQLSLGGGCDRDRDRDRERGVYFKIMNQETWYKNKE